jgi:hypothetical protein
VNRFAPRPARAIARRDVLQHLDHSFRKQIAGQRIACFCQVHGVHDDQRNLFGDLVELQILAVDEFGKVPDINCLGIFRSEAVVSCAGDKRVRSKRAAIIKSVNAQIRDRSESVIYDSRPTDRLAGAWLTKN